MTSTFLHSFTLSALKKASGSMPDYWIMNNALGWFEKGILVETDLEELQSLIDAKNAPAEEPELEEPLE